MKPKRNAQFPAVGLALALAGCVGTPPQEAAAQPGRGMLQYEATVNKIIADHFRYPPAALRASETGVTVVQVRIARDGTVLGERLLQKSGSSSIDRESLDLFERIHKFPPMPAEFDPGVENFAFTVPIDYGVSGSAAPNGQPMFGDPADGKWSASWR
jgi:TonB family protein